ncbi:chorismate mutase [Sulfurisphaera ohwakuensis]|uniref:chorismate mutase n=1 Tax=Sulfurisphaera ohwakuensis TaxID=69656 RepID=UPI0036F19DA5
MSAEIDELRKEIEAIDKQILELLSRRLKISAKIGEIKSRIGKDVTDEKREQKVREYWYNYARNLGIPDSMVESILPILFSYSKMVQINPGKKKNITVIGYGGMARSLISLFSLVGHNVVVTGRNKEKAERLASEFKVVYMDLDSALNWGEYIILALSPSSFDYILRISPKFTSKVVMDIFSSKNEIFKELEKLSEIYSFNYISTHPLFGPITYPVGERIVIIPSKTSKNVNEIINFWRECGLNTTVSTVEEHEKAMAIVQVLAHFYILGLHKSIDELRKELGIENLSNFYTTNFKELNKIIEKVSNILPVILEIQKSNPYAYKVRDIGVNELQKIKEELGG